MTHAHGHSHGHSHAGHRECSTPPPPPGTVDLEALKREADARAEAERRISDQGDGLSPIVDVTPDNFEPEVVIRSEQVPVVVLIGSAGAPDSVRLRMELEEMVRAAGLNWLLAWVDADTQMDVARAFGVQALPTVVGVAMGQPIGQFVGEQTRDYLDQWIEAVLDATKGRLKGLPAGTRMMGEDERGPVDGDESAMKPPTDDPRLEQAEEKLNEGDFDGAVAVYDEILKSEPANAELKAARTNIAFLARAQKIDRSSDPVARADADPANVELALEAADVEMLVGDPSLALERLLTLLPTVFGDDRESVKARLLDLLQLFDAADPVALDARRRMASALF
ncbi:tetratricopeptide repeat protein [uncultured Corynebacterium sp.]|uniref:tetratricopeptide repeat protein n=1 Tax=uncultured Corynebacterium sp. TaxID=159447 RepID=UPI0025F4668B|nr:tetratricopeptide repeat protein [uncultured Corynebacterium sp.]